MARKEWSLLVGVALLASFLPFSGAAVAAPGYFVQADIIRGSAGKLAGPRCVPTSVFVPGEAVVFRARVLDATTGRELKPSAVKARGLQVKVRLSNGRTMAARYIRHPKNPHAPSHGFYWSAMWKVPENAPAGHVTWQISASDKEGRKGRFAPIGQELGIADLQIVARAR